MTGNADQSPYITPLVRLWGSDKNVIAYRPEIARLTGSATSALLLQQIYFRWEGKSFAAFYKFKETCTHKLYQAGDSWCEELAFGRTEFDTALKKIGTKVKSGKSKQSAFNWELPRQEDFPNDESGYKAALAIAISHVVIYWTDGDHKTWYAVNPRLLHQILTLAYDAKVENPLQGDCEESAKSGNQLYLDKVENPLHLLTETSTENTNTSLEPAVSDAPKPKDKAPKEVIPAPDIALIEAYHYSLPNAIRPSKPAFGRYRDLAKQMVKAGITPYDVLRYVVSESPGYEAWALANKHKPVMSLNHVDQEIRGWLAINRQSSKPSVQIIQYKPVEHDDYVSPGEAV